MIIIKSSLERRATECAAQLSVVITREVPVAILYCYPSCPTEITQCRIVMEIGGDFCAFVCISVISGTTKQFK